MLIWLSVWINNDGLYTSVVYSCMYLVRSFVYSFVCIIVPQEFPSPSIFCPKEFPFPTIFCYHGRSSKDWGMENCWRRKGWGWKNEGDMKRVGMEKRFGM